MDFVIISVITAAVLGFVFGGGLALAAKKFHVEKDPRIDRVNEALPGANCGACGKPGCMGYAESIVLEDEDISLCIPGGSKTIEAIAKIMEKESTETEAKIVYLKCKGAKDISRDKAIYSGIGDCRAANLVLSGNKQCDYGCLGFGTCVQVCPFDAISMNPETELPVIDEKKCTGCGKCVQVCPKNLLQPIKKINKVFLACSTRDKGKVVKNYCSNGCISCMICVKKCPEQAIKMVNNLPVIDYEKCISCGVCVHVCPTNSYVDRVKNRSKFFIDTKCIGCGECVPVCPFKAISGEENKKHNVDKTRCVGCGLCIEACPVKAIRVMGALGYINE